MKWWTPLVALPLGLVALLAVGVTVDPGAATRVRHVLREAFPHNGSTLQMDDGVHKLYVAWNADGVQEATIDDVALPPGSVSVADDVIRIRGAKDGEGWPLYELVPVTSAARLATLPGDAVERLGLRLAAEPDADGAWPVHADSRPMGPDRPALPGPAQAAGVRTGDALIAVDGKRPPTREALSAALQARRGDEPLPLLVRRDGMELELVVRPLALTAENFWVYEELAAASGADARNAAGSDDSR